MIAMHVAYEHRLQTLEIDFAPTQLHLGSFGTIQHKYLSAEFYYLRRSIMFERRQSTATAENVNPEWLHDDYFFITRE